MPFLLFFKLGAVRARDAGLGGGRKKKEVDVWVCGCFGFSGCVGVYVSLSTWRT